MSKTSANSVSPWYRQFWPWFVIALLMWGVTSSLIFVSFAVSNPPEIIRGDYAQLGKAIVDTHVRADRAQALGLSGQIEMDSDGWIMRLAAADPSAVDQQLLLIARHPTDGDQDQSMLLLRSVDDNSYDDSYDNSYGNTLVYRAEFKAIPERGRLIVSNVSQDWWISSLYQREDGQTLRVELKPERL